MTVPQPPTSPTTTPLPITKPAAACPADTPTTTAAAPPSFTIPPLSLQIPTLTHPGATALLSNTIISTALPKHITTVLTHLYVSPKEPTTHLPPTKSVALFLRPMDGVAYTIGTQAVDGAKEIHFSVDYISRIAAARVKDEIAGVLVHELVHCFQYNGLNTCPSGLIEGIADWVRLRAKLAPPHWKRSTDGGWAAGYEKTGFFLEWLDQNKGDGKGGVVRKMNEWLRKNKYQEGKFWRECVGGEVGGLWKEYGKFVAGGGK
ncbi:hypothetical protein VE01_04798 [Pseudogymnoascus verrucosus]|uniref:Uncharacterized protein n=1 Tax=Pseudogymnoascus verrucosus TaxID=342668 RepID=A0A1B8GMQ7_9PEZI|nr:uncharacterized protein VE01_04798 [Pseudogymnoascus verrucosus]OBT97120.1 hypothetical protein VE01_04798 [Pseudogymnoascus verrucosus]